MRTFVALAVLTLALVGQPEAGRIRVQTTFDNDTISITRADSADTTTTRLNVAALRSMLGPSAPVPPEDLERLTPEQIERLAKIAIISRGRHPDSVATEVAADTVLPIFITAIVFLPIPVIVWLVMRHRREIARDQHELRLAMVQQGTYDPALFAPPSRQMPRSKDKTPRTTAMVIWGLILSLAGAALLVAEVAHSMAIHGFLNGLGRGLGDSGFELLLLTVGVALILAAEYVKRENRGRASSPGDEEDTYDGGHNSPDVR